MSHYRKDRLRQRSFLYKGYMDVTSLESFIIHRKDQKVIILLFSLDLQCKYTAMVKVIKGYFLK